MLLKNTPVGDIELETTADDVNGDNARFFVETLAAQGKIEGHGKRHMFGTTHKIVKDKGVNKLVRVRYA